MRNIVFNCSDCYKTLCLNFYKVLLILLHINISQALKFIK